MPESIGNCTSWITPSVSSYRSLQALQASIGNCALLTELGLSKSTMVASFPEITLATPILPPRRQHGVRPCGGCKQRLRALRATAAALAQLCAERFKVDYTAAHGGGLAELKA